MRGKLAGAVIVLALQLLLHAASFYPDARLTVSSAFLLWLLAVASVGFMVDVPDNPLWKYRADTRPTISQRELWTALPTWLKVTFTVLAGYLAITFVLAVFVLRHGAPQESAGRYWAESRKFGIAAHAITAAEYWKLEEAVVRLIATIGALIAATPVAALVWHGRRQRSAG